jgi:predicted transcriptional regulator
MEETVYQIAVELINQSHQSLDINDLFNAASSRLNQSPREINTAIANLIKAKKIVEGTLLTQEDVLTNQTRATIYQYIQDNPGCRVRDIRRAAGIDHAESHWHTRILEKFGFVRKKRFGKYLAFYDVSLPTEELDEILCMLRVDTTYRVFYDIFVSPGSNQKDVAERVGVHPSTIKYHVDKLVELGLLSASEDSESNQVIYNVNTELWTKVLDLAPSFSG